MSKQANPALIGSFVLGAVVLIALGVMIFGGGEIFKRKLMFVTYIDGSVKGLRTGSSVLFRGVPVGYVSEIQLIMEVESLEFRTAVYLELVPGSMTQVHEGVRLESGDNFSSIDDLIEAGLRSQLNTESYVTGQLVVQLDLHPDTPVVLRGVKPRHQEIPSIPSDIQKVVERVQRFFSDVQQNLDLKELTDNVEGIVSGANAIVNAPELRSAIVGLDQLINSEDSQQLSSSIRTTLRSLDVALLDLQELLDNANASVGPALDELAPAIQDLRGTLSDGRRLLTAAEAQIGESSQLSYRLNRSLEEVERAARSLRQFLDQLDRHPESLLKGKRAP